MWCGTPNPELRSSCNCKKPLPYGQHQRTDGGIVGRGNLTIASQYKKNVQMQSNEIRARSVVWKLQSTDERNQRPKKRGSTMLTSQSLGSHELSAPTSLCHFPSPGMNQSLEPVQFKSESQQDMLSVETNKQTLISTQKGKGRSVAKNN